ncbi:MAG: alpha/beta hydrolase [Spirochaetaceae bacterium]|nr:alpha/beta hydrolase [Spirochaetaceae bacterium]
MTSVELHVRETGSGLPVVLLHAFPLSSAMWMDQRNGLAEVARVVTPDLRGFGGSHLGHDEPSLDHVADDVASMLDRLGLDSVVLGGLSMGGYAAMAFARRHPHRLRGLVLADTKATADPPSARDKRKRIAARLDAEGTVEALVDEVLPALCGPTTVRARPLVLGRVKGLVEAAPPAAAAWAQRAMAARPDSLDVLREVAVPALVVRGDEDELSTREDAEAMVDALPDARMEVLAGSGHLSAVEVPDEFTAVVRKFLTDVG